MFAAESLLPNSFAPLHLLSFQQFPASYTLTEKVTRFRSTSSSLFFQNTRGVGVRLSPRAKSRDQSPAITPLDSVLTKFPSVTPLDSALTQNHPGWGTSRGATFRRADVRTCRRSFQTRSATFASTRWKKTKPPISSTTTHAADASISTFGGCPRPVSAQRKPSITPAMGFNP